MEDTNKTEMKSKIKRRFKGNVVSAKMTGTVLVNVKHAKVHPKYGKRYTRSKNYPSQIGSFELSEGDTVIIEETRPISKTKRYRIIEKVK